MSGFNPKRFQTFTHDGSFQVSAALAGFALVTLLFPEHAFMTRGFNETGGISFKTFTRVCEYGIASSFIVIVVEQTRMCCSDWLSVLRSGVPGLGVRQRGPSDSHGAD